MCSVSARHGTHAAECGPRGWIPMVSKVDKWLLFEWINKPLGIYVLLHNTRTVQVGFFGWVLYCPNFCEPAYFFVTKPLVFLIYGRCGACRGKKSLQTGSFFNEFPRTAMGKLLSVIYLWSMREPRATAARMLGMTKNAVGNVYAILRHYCGEDLGHRPIIPFGGQTHVVKCDESQFNHKPKVCIIGIGIRRSSTNIAHRSP